MIRTEPIIGVSDVEKSSSWYQSLLGCKSNHGGSHFEILADQNDKTVLCLHKWGEHDHPTMSKSKETVGNGLILYFRVDDLDRIWQNAQDLGAQIETKPHLSKNSHKEEFSIRDLDNYFLTISL